MSGLTAPPLSPPPPFRPGVAKRHSALSLRARLALMVTLVVALVIGLASYLQLRVFEQSLRADLLEAARLTAQAVADDLEVRAEPLSETEINESLHDFIEAVPTLRVISLVTIRDGQPVVVASTSSGQHPEVVEHGRRAIERNAIVWPDDRGILRTLAAPAYRNGRSYGAIVVTYSLASVNEARTRGRRVALWFTPAAILALTLLVDLLARRLVHGPIRGIRDTMQRVARRDFDARAPIVRHDEIGAVAEGLNEMLAEMQNFNVELQERVREATEELRGRNAELEESYRRIFALREALARAEQMAAVGHTAASVAHQIGTPLNLISGYVQLVREEAGASSRLGRRLAIVEEQIARVTSIVRTMLDRARQPSPREPTDPARLLERVCEVAQPKLQAAGVQLDLRVGDAAPTIQADAVQLELALLNLITNSLDAMPSGGRLAISLAGTGEGVRIHVADTGSGIPPDLLPRIFEPWVTTKATGHGTGLGLSITREVIAAHGGSITAASEPGNGAVFTIDLPAAVAEAGTIHRGDHRERREQDGQSARRAQRSLR